MKIATLGLSTLAAATSVFADATIQFSNRTITKTDGSGTYDVPIWADNYGSGLGTVGAGSLPGGVTVGLFFNGLQIASTPLRVSSSPQFFAISSQTATIPGVSPGTSQTLEVRAWQGPSYEAAILGSLGYGRWTFTSKLLGGIDASNNIFLPPTMTGWGPENGLGVEFSMLIPEPTTLAFSALGAGAILLLQPRKRHRSKSDPS